MAIAQAVRIGLCAVIILLLPLAVFAQDDTAPDGPDGPRLEVPVTEFDFGFVPQNVRISHTFWLLNTGTDSLFIRDVKPG